MDAIPLSALQHFLYCPRQCALIHLEQLWAENRETAEGRILHERADLPGAGTRKGVRIATAMALSHDALALAGKADVVEFHSEGDGGECSFPVEYKRGRPKAHQADEVQLCAQALCLEDMYGKPVPRGALFYGQTRRRKDVVFDRGLRELTLKVLQGTRAMLESRQTPSAIYEAKKCDSCSLVDLCMPQCISRQRSVQRWLMNAVE